MTVEELIRELSLAAQHGYSQARVILEVGGNGSVHSSAYFCLSLDTATVFLSSEESGPVYGTVGR